jgi:Domain of unknown function (DUF4157)
VLLRAQLQKKSLTPKPVSEPKPRHEYVSSQERKANLSQFSYSADGVRTFSRGESEPTSGAPWEPLPFPLQAKLMVGGINDPLEQEADRVADQVMRMPVSVGDPAVNAAGSGVTGGFEAPPIVHDVLRSPGEPLDAATRAFMEPRFRYDFSDVRVHTDDKAAQSARAVGATAYAVGKHLTFGPGKFSPATEAGRRLLGHELAHVIQQKSNSTLQRQQANQPTPGFSVNQADYLKLVTQAIQSISGNLVQVNTLAPVIQPVLNSLSGQVIWRDDKGKESGGKEVAIPLPGTPKVVLQLRFVLDDRPDPKLAGEFEHKDTDKTHGTLSAMVRKATDESILKNVLYHEASHMLVWAMQNWGATRFAGQDRRSVRALNLSLHSREKCEWTTQRRTSQNHTRGPGLCCEVVAG